MAGSAEGLNKLLEESGIQRDSEAGMRMRTYLALLEKWNSTINLTASTEWSAIQALFLEAIRASAFYPGGAVAHLDIGSGGGFPAIPLRILQPSMQLELVESRGKRCVFLETVVNALEFREAVIHNRRLDALLQRVGKEKVWDCVSWKAIKLESSDLDMLRKHAHSKTQFWTFHGKELAVREPESFAKNFSIVRNENLGCGREWNLSVFRLS
jgi:16S rRNA (guanine(527)-N(7))-methyltransferase RsmG